MNNLAKTKGSRHTSKSGAVVTPPKKNLPAGNTKSRQGVHPNGEHKATNAPYRN